MQSLVKLFGVYDIGLFGLFVENGVLQGFVLVADGDVSVSIQADGDCSVAHRIGGSFGLDLIDDFAELEGQVLRERAWFLPGQDLSEIVLSGERAMGIMLEQIVIRDRITRKLQTFAAPALFVFIGLRPQSQLVADLVMRNEKGGILTGPDLMVDNKPPLGWTLDRPPFLLETSVPGIFAAGDVRFGTSHRVSAAAGEGAVAFALMKDYLKSL